MEHWMTLFGLYLVIIGLYLARRRRFPIGIRGGSQRQWATNWVAILIGLLLAVLGVLAVMWPEEWK